MAKKATKKETANLVYLYGVSKDLVREQTNSTNGHTFKSVSINISTGKTAKWINFARPEAICYEANGRYNVLLGEPDAEITVSMPKARGKGYKNVVMTAAEISDAYRAHAKAFKASQK